MKMHVKTDCSWQHFLSLSLSVTVLRAARSVLRAGQEASRRCSGRVRTNPRSKGGEEGGTISSVYSTPMKNKSDAAKTHGTGWYVTTFIASSIDHFIINVALPVKGFFIIPQLAPLAIGLDLLVRPEEQWTLCIPPISVKVAGV